jgi:N-acetyl-anhydromuramyl-L-alanine amidase AmpD
MINLNKILPLEGTDTAGDYLPVFNTIYIHCSATTPGGWINSAKRIHSLHVDQNGWDAIGYHYVIKHSGKIEGGRPRNRTGAGVSGRNSDSIHICLVGGLAADYKPSGEYSDAQWSSLEDLVKALLDESVSDFGRAPVIKGHRDTDPMKACPCFDVANWWAGVLKKGTEEPETVELSRDQLLAEGYDAGFEDAVVWMEEALEELRSKK